MCAADVLEVAFKDLLVVNEAIDEPNEMCS